MKPDELYKDKRVLAEVLVQDPRVDHEGTVQVKPLPGYPRRTYMSIRPDDLYEAESLQRYRNRRRELAGQIASGMKLEEIDGNEPVIARVSDNLLRVLGDSSLPDEESEELRILRDELAELGKQCSYLESTASDNGEAAASLKRNAEYWEQHYKAAIRDLNRERDEKEKARKEAEDFSKALDAEVDYTNRLREENERLMADIQHCEQEHENRISTDMLDKYREAWNRLPDLEETLREEQAEKKDLRANNRRLVDENRRLKEEQHCQNWHSSYVNPAQLDRYRRSVARLMDMEDKNQELSVENERLKNDIRRLAARYEVNDK